MALRWPGRLRVTVATPPSIAHRTSSDMACLLATRRWREGAHGVEHERAPARGVGVIGLELQEGRVDVVVEIALHARANGGQGTAGDELLDQRRGYGGHRTLAIAGRPPVPHRLEDGSAAEPFLVGAVHGHVEVGGDVTLDDLVRLRPGRVEVDEETSGDFDGLGI